MFSIRITLLNGEQYFIDETDYKSGFYFVNNIKEAFTYESTLEFKVTWKLLRRIIEEDSDNKNWFYKTIDYSFDKEKDVIKFETINHETLEAIEFDVNEQEIEINDDKIYLDKDTFHRMKVSGVGCSHWCYDKDDEWLAFARENDKLDDVFRIRYWRRGLTDTICSHNNWCDRYERRAYFKMYERQHKTMMNPILQQIVLLRHKYDHEYNLYEEL